MNSANKRYILIGVSALAVIAVLFIFLTAGTQSPSKMTVITANPTTPRSATNTIPNPTAASTEKWTAYENDDFKVIVPTRWIAKNNTLTNGYLLTFGTPENDNSPIMFTVSSTPLNQNELTTKLALFQQLGMRSSTTLLGENPVTFYFGDVQLLGKNGKIPGREYHVLVNRGDRLIALKYSYPGEVATEKEALFNTILSQFQLLDIK